MQWIRGERARAGFIAGLLVALVGCVHPANSIVEVEDDPNKVDPIPEVREPRIPDFAQPPYRDLTYETQGQSGGDYDVDVSPDGKWLVYSSTRHTERPAIYLKEIGAGGPIEKTRGQHQDIQPKFSPDGKWIAFASDREGNFDLWIIPTLENGAPWHLTSSPLDEIHPTWSPDGASIAYCAREQSGEWFLWIIDVDTQKRRQLGPGLYPEWSPDGKYLAFQRASLREPGWYGIWIVEATGGSPREIVTEESWATIQPSWSPNSRSLVYGTAREVAADPARPAIADDLWIVSLDGRRLRLTEHPEPDYAPAWGLNGRIYFTSHRGGSPRILSVLPGEIPSEGRRP